MKKIITVATVASACAMVACGGEPDQIDVHVNIEAPATPMTPSMVIEQPAATSTTEEAYEGETAADPEQGTPAITPRRNPFDVVLRPNQGRMAPVKEIAEEEQQEEVATDDELVAPTTPPSVEPTITDEPAAEEEMVEEPPVVEPMTPPVEVLPEEPEVSSSCVFVMQQELGVFTGLNSIAPSPNGFGEAPTGFFVSGDSYTEMEIVTPPFADAEPFVQPAMELQYWDLATMEGQHAFFAGQGTQFIGKGSVNHDFMAMVRWPEVSEEPYNGVQAYKPATLSSFLTTGDRYSYFTGEPSTGPWEGEEPWQGLVRSIETDQGVRVFWVYGDPESNDTWWLRSSIFGGGDAGPTQGFGPAGNVSQSRPMPYDLKVDTSGSYIGTAVSDAEGVVVHLWTEESTASVTRDFGGADVFDFFGTADGEFAFVWYERATGRRYLSVVSVSEDGGMAERLTLLPEDILRIAPSTDGFVTITSNPEDATSFLFQRFSIGSQELELVESISFGADFEIYPLRTGNLAQVGEGTFAFTWSGVIGGERSNIAAFQCE